MNIFEAINALLINDASALSDLALFLLRLVVAAVFYVSFASKIKNIKGFAASNGLPVTMAYVSVFAELFGAISLSLGILTQLGALAIMGIMAVSMSFHIFKWKSPYWASKGGWEYDLMIFLITFVIFAIGGGAIALYPYF